MGICMSTNDADIDKSFPSKIYMDNSMDADVGKLVRVELCKERLD
jgi:hypothetical protein